MSDLSFILNWWVVIFLLGVFFLPLTFTVFKNFFDKGYIFSKILGIAVVSYAVFLLGILHIAPFSFLTSALVLIFFGILNFAFIIRGKSDGLKNFLMTLKKNWLIFIFKEILFILCLLLWSYVRSFQPDIHGLEKYMDFGILNSILRSDYFPPKDMWFTPLPINYYYFGHLTTAVLTKLSNIPSSITFNLMIASIFAFTFVGSFSIGANLIKSLFEKRGVTEEEGFPTARISTNVRGALAGGKLLAGPRVMIGGFLTAFLVSFGGNLQTVYAFFKNYVGDNPVPFWHLPFSISTFPNNYWYPNATRFIYHTIHEFPLYSFVVSDLHGHVLDIPFVLLTIAILLSLIFNFQFSIFNHTKKFQILNFKFQILLLSFFLAVMYMTNAWDGFIYFLLTGLVICFLGWKQQHKYSAIGLLVVLVFIGSIIFSYPFNHFFKPFVSGIGIVCPPDFLIKAQKLGPFIFEGDHCQKSPWWQIFILYGFFYFWVLSFLAFILKKMRQNGKWKMLVPRSLGEVGEIRNLTTSDTFVFLLILLSTVLIIIPEIIYVKDIYPAHYRANTMFKLVYQSFIMLSIASSYIIIRLTSNLRNWVSKSKSIALICSILGVTILTIVFIYPYFAINSFYGNLKVQLGLDGTKYLKNLYPTDYDAIIWINKNIKGQPVILEAQGDSYTDFARVSANTGLATVLGWTVHEWLWRGTYDIPAPRIPEVQTLYESPDINITKNLINKYKIEYIFIGDLEYQKYPKLDEQKFSKIGKVIYKKRRTEIYKITQQ